MGREGGHSMIIIWSNLLWELDFVYATQSIQGHGSDVVAFLPNASMRQELQANNRGHCTDWKMVSQSALVSPRDNDRHAATEAFHMKEAVTRLYVSSDSRWGRKWYDSWFSFVWATKD